MNYKDLQAQVVCCESQQQDKYRTENQQKVRKTNLLILAVRLHMMGIKHLK